MLWFLVLLVGATGASSSASYAETPSGNFVGGGGAFYGSGGAVPFVFPAFPNFDFGNLFYNYFNQLQKYNQELASRGIPNAYSVVARDTNYNSQVQAQSSLTFKNGIQTNVERLGQQAADGGGYGGAYGGGSSGGYGGGFSGSYGGGSSATASIGDGQAHQTASVYPENPSVPNLDTRFATASAPGGGGFYGVFTSSQSGTKLVDGKPVSYQKAQTTVNDNGKVSTRVVSNP